jgi:hypothetical protein
LDKQRLLSLVFRMTLSLRPSWPRRGMRRTDCGAVGYQKWRSRCCGSTFEMNLKMRLVGPCGVLAGEIKGIGKGLRLTFAEPLMIAQRA